MKFIRIISEENAGADLAFWLEKSAEERIGAVEFLREQFYAIQGYSEIPRIVKIVNMIGMNA